MSQRSAGSAVLTTDARVRGLVSQILTKTPRCSAFSQSSALARGDTLANLGLASMDMVSLMLALEREFDLEIPAAEITPDSFASVETIVALVTRLAPEIRLSA